MTYKDKIISEINRRLDAQDPLNYTEKDHIESNVYYSLLKYNKELSKDSVSEDLEKEVDVYILDNFDDVEGRVYVLQCARHFANWQKEQMMKDAIDGKVCWYDGEVFLDTDDSMFLYLYTHKGFKVGDKMKVIIIKED